MRHTIIPGARAPFALALALALTGCSFQIEQVPGCYCPGGMYCQEPTCCRCGPNPPDASGLTDGGLPPDLVPPPACQPSGYLRNGDRCGGPQDGSCTGPHPRCDDSDLSGCLKDEECQSNRCLSDVPGGKCVSMFEGRWGAYFAVLNPGNAVNMRAVGPGRQTDIVIEGNTITRLPPGYDQVFGLTGGGMTAAGTEGIAYTVGGIVPFCDLPGQIPPGRGFFTSGMKPAGCRANN